MSSERVTNFNVKELQVENIKLTVYEN